MSATAPAARRGDLRNYVIVTAAYWADTVTDGAIRTLVLFSFYERGYSPFAVASLFLFYELFGVVTNLVGGWLAARLGLEGDARDGPRRAARRARDARRSRPSAWLVVPYVMASQALSGIAKDLTKMSSKSAVKLVVPEGSNDALFRWVAILTGSKNALKGVGFFLGGLLLTLIGFRASQLLLAGGRARRARAGARADARHARHARSQGQVRADVLEQPRASTSSRPRGSCSSPPATSGSSSACPCSSSPSRAGASGRPGAFLAVWVIGYGGVQAIAPGLLRRRGGGDPTGRTAMVLAFVLALFPAAIALGLAAGIDPALVVVVGLACSASRSRSTPPSTRT